MSRDADRSRITPASSVARRSAAHVSGCLLALAALALSACGGGDAAAGDGASENPNDPRNSPLAQLLGFDTSPAEQRANELEVQQQIVECMQDEGWEYVAVDWTAQSGDLNAEWEEQIGDPVGYGEKYGYGVVRSYEMQGEVSSSTFEDPNGDYLNSLTTDEQTAYNESLYGVSPEFEADEEFVMPSLEEQGCYGKAQLAVNGDSPMNDPDLQERLNELFEDAESDPQVLDAYEAWASCMRDRDASYEFDRPEDAGNSFWERMNELQGFGTASEGGDLVAETDSFAGVPEIDEADLEELRADELATWKDDWACQEDAKIADIRREVEQRLADDLVAEFPELGES